MMMFPTLKRFAWMTAMAIACVISTTIAVDAHDHEMQHDGSADSMPEHYHHSPARSIDADYHHHGTLEVLAGEPIPSLELRVHTDEVRGWNLELVIANFDFVPEQVNQSSLSSEGHAHLYVNGEKITRLYSPWYYLESLPPGLHEITVELNANGHEVLTHNGVPIRDTFLLEVTENP